jgi:nucleotide-binding universal stress UspA family protein
MIAVSVILHPTDFSGPSRDAFDLACSLARDHGARVVVLHVLPVLLYGDLGPVLPPPTEELEQALRELRPADPGVEVEYRLTQGEPAREILAEARDCGCDLIVMGTHGRTGLGRLLMGSVAEQVVRKAPCPVLTVKAPLPAAASRPAAMDNASAAAGVS